MDLDISQILIGLVGTVIAVWLISLLNKFFIGSRLEMKGAGSEGHHWLLVKAFPAGYYCNVCAIATFHGAECDHCGAVVDDICLRKSSLQRLSCKNTHSPSGGKMSHFWLDGNLNQGSECFVCGELCGDGPGLVDRRCCWCQITVHSATACQSRVGRECDFGQFKTMVIPPHCATVRITWTKGRRFKILDKITPPENVQIWSPLIVIGNRKSGDGQADILMQKFRRILNPLQILDLHKIPPEVYLRCIKMNEDVKFRILIAAGDGTIGWMLSTIEAMNLPAETQPLISVVPIGTGNDLSRILGWGSEVSAITVNGDAWLKDLDTRCQELKVDRWSVAVENRRRFGLRAPNQNFTMTNYFSIGVDAAVTLNYHESRYSIPRVVSGRFINKMLFFHYGTRDVLEHACHQLNKKIELTMDGKKVVLPELEGLVLLNIPFWGAGVRPWDLGSSEDHPKQGTDDGLLEVFGVYSSFHIAQMQVGLSEPLRLGQASDVRIRVFSRGKPLPAQIDGEPWRQTDGTITVKRKCQARFLQYRGGESDRQSGVRWRLC